MYPCWKVKYINISLGKKMLVSMLERKIYKKYVWKENTCNYVSKKIMCICLKRKGT